MVVSFGGIALHLRGVVISAVVVDSQVKHVGHDVPATLICVN